MNIEVSVVMPAHHEGRLVHPTMRSILRTVEYARNQNISVEIVIVMDKADDKTENYFKKFENSEIVFEKVDYGDLGLTRNHGVNAAKGRYITFIDADNLFGLKWICAFYNYLEKLDRDVIVHPEYHVVFEDENVIWKQLSSTDPAFNVGNFFENNYWDANCAAKKSQLLNYPYKSTTSTKGFGFEDWHFNCETIANGVEHHVVPQTVHFLRKKKFGSLLASSRGTSRIIRPTKLFEPALLASLLKDRENSNRELAK